MVVCGEVTARIYAEMQTIIQGILHTTGGFWGFCRLGTFTLICSGNDGCLPDEMDPLVTKPRNSKYTQWFASIWTQYCW